MDKEIVDYKFWQYPRGENKGGVLNVDVCPTISCSSFQHNCLLIEIYKEEKEEQKPNGNIKSIHRI